MVALEELLLERVRGAFLVSWFGTHFPMEGFALRISFANLDALRQRFAAVQAASAEFGQAGLNLTEPVAGLAGMLAGIFTSPFPALMVGIAVAVLGTGWLTKLLGALHAATLGGLTGAVGVLAFPLAIIGIIVLAVDDPQVAQAYGLMGALAALLTAVPVFINQLLGPREGARNPLVRAVLGLFDRVAAIFALLIGMGALIFARLQPLILPLVDQAIALYQLFQEVMEVIWIAIYDLIFSLGVLREGRHAPFAVVMLVLGSIRRGTDALGERIVDLLSTIESGLVAIGTRIAGRVEGFLTAAAASLRSAVEDHPLSQALERALAIMPAVIRALLAIGKTVVSKFSSSGGSSSDEPGMAGRALGWVYSLGPPMPPLPETPSPLVMGLLAGQPPASVSITATAEHSPTYVFLSEEAMAELERMRQGAADPFRLERRTMADAAGRTPEQQLADLRTEQLPLREMLAVVVGRVLPPAAAPYVRDMDDLFRLVDRELFGLPEGTALRRELPVRALAESDRLRVEVNRLRVRMTGGEVPVARAWADHFADALRAQTYVAANTPEG